MMKWSEPRDSEVWSPPVSAVVWEKTQGLRSADFDRRRASGILSTFGMVHVG